MNGNHYAKKGCLFECFPFLGRAERATLLIIFLVITARAARGATNGVKFLQSEFVVDFWQTEQGLPDNFVTGIQQTSDGYLWVATLNGLARFNGVEFVVFDSSNVPELEGNRVSHLTLDREHRLWMIGSGARVLSLIDGKFRHYTERDGIDDNRIGTAQRDWNGEVWFTHNPDSTNAWHFVNGAFKSEPGNDIFHLRFGITPNAKHRGWSVSAGKLYSMDSQGRAEYSLPPGADTQVSGWRVVNSADGGVWLMANGIWKFKNDEWTTYAPPQIGTDRFDGFIEDRQGNLWIGVATGEIWRVSAAHGIERFVFQNVSTAQPGRSIFEDHEGNIWLGTAGAGLARLKPLAIKTYDSRHGLASDVVRSVTEDAEGNVVLSTVNSVDRYSKETDRFVPMNLDDKIDLPWAVRGARNGDLWIGTYGRGVVRYRNGKVSWYENMGRPDGGKPPIFSIYENLTGVIRLGTPYGLSHINLDGAFETETEGPEGIIGAAVWGIRGLAEDRHGNFYVAFTSAGLARKSQSGWEMFSKKNGLPALQVMALFVDEDDTLWLSTYGNGLTRFKDNRFYTFHSDQIELPQIITCIIEDDEKQIWMGSNHGIYRTDRRQLNAIADGKSNTGAVRRYLRSDGMGSSQCTPDFQPAVWKAKDGRLWFATMKGVSVVDPKALPAIQGAPNLVMEGIFIDENPADLRDEENPKVARAFPSLTGKITVPPSAHRLEFRYAGLSLSSPEGVRYRYRLDNFDKGWVRAADRRSAFYTKIPHGTYRFHVIAANSDNVWNETGASIAVTVLPFVWQRAWFRAACFLCGVGFIGAAVKMRLHQLEQRRAQQESFSRRLLESQENERKRIASELHDSLGQSLLVVKTYAAVALKETGLAEKTRGQLEEISETASASIEEVRSIARALRPYQLDRFGLTKTLEDTAELLAKSSRLTIDIKVQDIDGAFSRDAEINIYRIVQEWLNNVAKHAQATVAKLRVHRHGNVVQMIMEDNGIGFDYEAILDGASGKTAFGLANLRERVRLLNGELRIQSSSGKGALFIIEMPCQK